MLRRIELDEFARVASMAVALREVALAEVLAVANA